MGRIHSSYIYVCYPVENGSNVKSIDEKLEEIPDRFIYKLDMNIHAILYKKTRFDIKREEQVRSLFKVASILPTVSAIKKKKVEEMQTSILENIEVRNDDIIALGIFKIKYDEFISKRRHNDLILETERLKKELKDSKATNITNIMIPNIYMNIKMNSLGTEDISHYTLEDIRNAMKKSSQMEDFLANLIDKILIVRLERICGVPCTDSSYESKTSPSKPRQQSFKSWSTNLLSSRHVSRRGSDDNSTLD
jgi:hypothetical protein